MSDGLSQQASQPPLAGGGGGSQVPSVISTGVINTGLSITLALGAQSTGSVGQSLADTAVLTVPLGTSGRSMAVSQLTGADTISLGTSGRSMAVSQLTGADTISLGSRGASMSVDSTILGRGLVTTASTAGGTVWTNPNNVKLDDAAVAQWFVQDALGAGTGTTSSGTLTATNPALGTTPAGFTRTKVEVLFHYNDSTSGSPAVTDTFTFTAVLQDKTGASLQTIVNDSWTGTGSVADSTKVVDVTTATNAISDADLALTKFLLTATWARTLAATGTRTAQVNVDSISLRVTYTRTGIT